MADVWIMHNNIGEGEDYWKSHVLAVVLRNHKVIAKDDEDKELLEYDIKMAQSRYERAGRSGNMPTEDLFRYLSGLHQKIYYSGSIVSIEDAREYVKLSGGM